MIFLSWAEIKKAVNSNLSKPINELITDIVNAAHTQRIKIYEANTIFTVPSNVYAIYVTAIASGGNGYSSLLGGGGGCGNWCYRKPIAVSPNTEYSVVVGSGNTTFGGARLVLLKGESGSATSGGKGGNNSGFGGFAYSDSVEDDPIDTIKGGIRDGGFGAGGFGHFASNSSQYCKAGNGGIGTGYGGSGGRAVKGPRNSVSESRFGSAGGGGSPIYFVGINGASCNGGDGCQNGSNYGAGGGSGGGLGGQGVMIIEW